MRKADEGSLSAICTHSPYPQFLMRLTVFVGNPNSALWLRLPKIGGRRKGWRLPTFSGHLTFLKMSRIRGTQTAKPTIEANAESE